MDLFFYLASSTKNASNLNFTSVSKKNISNS